MKIIEGGSHPECSACSRRVADAVARGRRAIARRIYIVLATTHFADAVLGATIAARSLLQLRQEIRQVEELFLRLNFPFLVELEEADAVDEEDVSGLSLKT